MGRKKVNDIIESRMHELFNMALEDEKNNQIEYAHIKYELIFRYSKKFKIKRPDEFKIWVCRKCRYPIYGGGGSIRIRNSTIIVRCGHCGYIRRFRINHSSIVSALKSTL